MADTSTQQMALTRDTGPGGFMERVTGDAGVCDLHDPE